MKAHLENFVFKLCLLEIPPFSLKFFPSHVVGLEVIHVSGYDLVVEETAYPSNQNKRILLSRNHPVSIIVGSAGFVGSHLTEVLLESGIQVIGIDDLSTGRKENLTQCFKNKNFHFLHQSINDERFKSNLKDLPRVDYAFFIAENPTTSSLYKTGLVNFLELVQLYKSSSSVDIENESHHKSDRPKIVFISSIQIYDNSPEGNLNYLKSAENQFAKFIKHNGLNGRVVRLAEVFGPRMHFRGTEAFSRLIKACLEKKLAKEDTSLDFSTRGLFVEDAVMLILKSVLAGSTSGKIYDGCLPQPIKIEEIKQILLSPDWHLESGFLHTQLPPWPTPNLDRSLKELSWKPKVSVVRGLKETINFFEQDEDAKAFALKQKKEIEEQKKITGWSFSEIEENGEGQKSKKHKPKKGFNSFIWGLTFLIILLGVFYPLISFILGAFAFPTSLNNVKQSLEAGDLDAAKRSLAYAQISNSQMNNLQPVLKAFINTGLLPESQNLSNLLAAQSEGITGVGQSLEALEQTSRFLNSTNQTGDSSIFLNSQTHLSIALSILADEKFEDFSLLPNRAQLLDRSVYQYFYNLSESGRGVSTVLPLVLNDKEKNYLILITDKSKLQPQGGKLIQIGELRLKKGSILIGDIKSVDQLDQQLQEKNILFSQNNLSTPAKFSNISSADFPTFAQNIKAVYQSLSGKQIDGVVMLEMGVIKSLEELTGEKVESDPTLSQLLGKSLDNQNLFKSAQIFDSALSHKQMMIYSGDGRLETIISGLNWDGSVKTSSKEEGFKDFLSVLENNQSAISNDQIKRDFLLKSNISRDGGVTHNLTINYSNESLQIYTSNLQIVLPLGSKLDNARVGETNVVFSSFVDFGRAIYNGNIAINPGIQQVNFEYSLPSKLEVGEQGGSYLLKINKQSGSQEEGFNWQLNYPFSWDLVSKLKDVDTTKHQINVETNIDADKTFEIYFKKP